MVVDVTWPQNSNTCNFSRDHNIPYFPIDISMNPFQKMLEKYMKLKEVEDVVILLENSDSE